MPRNLPPIIPSTIYGLWNPVAGEWLDVMLGDSRPLLMWTTREGATAHLATLEITPGQVRVEPIGARVPEAKVLPFPKPGTDSF